MSPESRNTHQAIRSMRSASLGVRRIKRVANSRNEAKLRTESVIPFSILWACGSQLPGGTKLKVSLSVLVRSVKKHCIASPLDLQPTMNYGFSAVFSGIRGMCSVKGRSLAALQL